LIPYSSVGYKIKYDAENDTENSRRFNGTGGLNKAFLGVGYQINRNLSVGADANYNFGKIESTSFEYINGVPVVN
jgi:outer membrane autotransporter protein